MAETHKLEGFVYNYNSLPQADRVVRAYRRDYGTLIGEATTGNGNVVSADEHYNNVSLLLKFDGLNGETTTTDLSPTPKTVTFNGNAALSNVQKKYGETSCYFDGTGDYLTVPSSADFGFGLSDFTIECWINISGGQGTDRNITDFRMSSGSDVGTFFIDGTTDKLAFWFGSKIGSTGTALTTGVWYHVSLVRNSGIFLCFLNGVLDWSARATADFGATRLLTIGSTVAPGHLGAGPFNGYIDDLRITKGVARYGFFNTPTTEILEIKPTFEDLLGTPVLGFGNAQLSPTQKKFGSVSASFDGSGDYLSFPNSGQFNLGASDFTIEFWMRPASVAGHKSVIDARGLFGDVDVSFAVGISTTSNVRFLADVTSAGSGHNGAWNIDLLGATTLVANTWYHVAIVRNGSSWTIYLNGVSDASASTSFTIGNASSTIYIGGGASGASTLGYFYEGYLQDLRITKGFARYISNFTPPRNSYFDTTTLTDSYDANVVLDLPLDVPEDPYWNQVVLAMTMDGIDNGTSFTDAKGHTIVRTGCVTKTATKRFGTASAYFDGTASKHLYVTTGEEFNFGTGDFTIEAWVNIGSFGDERGILYKYTSWGSNVDFALRTDTTTGLLRFLAGDNTSINIASNVAVSIGTFFHVAVCRVAGTTKLYIDGVAQTATHTGSVSIPNDSGTLRIGTFNGTLSPMLGYIDDLRITKGIARYTKNFTPPTKSFMAIEDKKGHTLTENGDVKVVGGNIAKFGNGATYFDGSGDYLNLNSTDFDYGLGDFTIECWVNFQGIGSGYPRLIEQVAYPASNGFGLNLINNSATPTVFLTNNSGSVITSTSTLVVGNWTHVAATRQSGTLRLFLNGVKEGTDVVGDTTNCSSGFVRIGTGTGGNDSLKGYLQDVRLTKGVARYTANFTPPIKSYNYDPTDYFDEYNILKMPLQELPVANGDPYESSTVLNMRAGGRPDNGDPYRNNVVLNMRMEGVPGVKTFKDDCGNGVTVVGDVHTSNIQKKFGETSAYFDGVGDYLNIIGNNSFNLSAENFTIEAWVFRVSAINTTVISLCTSFGSNNGLHFWIAANGNLVQDNGITGTTGYGQVPTGQWSHVVACRSGGSTNLFIDGVMVGTHSQAPNNASLARIGAQSYNGDMPFNGYIDDLRITKGVARYTSDFTPPAQIPKITKPLLFKDDKSNTITASGDTKFVTTPTTAGGIGSLYFDGSGDYLEISPNPLLILGAADFTVEMWIKPTLSGTIMQLFTTANTVALGFSAAIYSDGKLWISYTTILDFLKSNKTIAINEWTHIAITRTANSFRIFINGVLDNSISYSATFSASGSPRIGAFGASNYYQGYIDDLRITKGFARYTSDFTPPAQTHPSTEYGGNALGKFTIPTNFTGETYVVVLPHETEVTNMKVKDRVVPVLA